MRFNNLRLGSTLLNLYVCSLPWRARAKISLWYLPVRKMYNSLGYPQIWKNKKSKTNPVASTVNPSLPPQKHRRDCWGHQGIFSHDLHSKDTGALSTGCCRPREVIATCLSYRWTDFSSESYFKVSWFGVQTPLLRNLWFDEEGQHKSGTAPFLYLLLCSLGTGRAQGDKGWCCWAARGGAAKQGSLQHRGLPQQLAVVAVIMHDT